MNSAISSIAIDDSIKQRFEGIYLSIREADVNVTNSYDISKHVAALRQGLRYDLESLKDNPIVRAYRDFYWRIGIDPTKTRPASEALLRRFLKNQNLPKINNVVDAGNISSVKTLVPIGLYDMNGIVGKLNLRSAKNGERFTDITGNTETLQENEIVLADEFGILHLFPHRDSQRTMVNANTKKILIVGCGVPGVPRSIVDAAAEGVVSILGEL
jgi:DNA/RNA-binding domain of Phe-tRNA-synthetase-like protein